MELNQLKYFQTVARTRSVTEAAELLFVSQSTLSQCITRLENSVGCPLFYRQKGKKLVLTDAGKTLLNTVDQILPELDQAVERTRSIGTGNAPQVSIVSALHGITGFIIADYLLKNKGVSISHKNVEVNDLKDLLLTQDIDFALAPCPVDDDRIEYEALYTEEMLLYVGPNHPMKGKKQVKVNELVNENFICSFGETDRFFIQKMLFNSLSINIICESSDNETINEMVSSDIGVILVPAGVARNMVEKRDEDKNRFIKITDYAFPVPYCIWKKKNRLVSKNTEMFYHFVIDYTKKEYEKNKAFLKYYE